MIGIPGRNPLAEPNQASWDSSRRGIQLTLSSLFPLLSLRHPKPTKRRGILDTTRSRSTIIQSKAKRYLGEGID